MKCIVKGCKNHTHEGQFIGDLCKPCHEFITTGNGHHSQAYKNATQVGALKFLEIIRDLHMFWMDRAVDHDTSPGDKVTSGLNASTTGQIHAKIVMEFFK